MWSKVVVVMRPSTSASSLAAQASTPGISRLHSFIGLRRWARPVRTISGRVALVADGASTSDEFGVSTDDFDLAVDGNAALVDAPEVVAEMAGRWAAGGGRPASMRKRCRADTAADIPGSWLSSCGFGG